MARSVPIEMALKLHNIFTEKKWTENASHDAVFERLCELSGCFDKKHMDFLLELTSRYTWLTFNDYQSQLLELMKDLCEQQLSNIDRLFIFPIMKPSDEESTKSGNAVMYMLKGIKGFLSEYQDIQFQQIEKFDELVNEDLKLGDSDYLILVDDYIGSGNTLRSTLTELNSNKSINGKFSVLTVMIQESTKTKLEESEISVFSGFTASRGISDYYEGEELMEKIKLMEEIERKIPKVKRFQFGYEKSEALATLIRTPNNTFPIFWKNCSNRGNTFLAPFSRF